MVGGEMRDERERERERESLNSVSVLCAAGKRQKANAVDKWRLV